MSDESKDLAVVLYKGALTPKQFRKEVQDIGGEILFVLVDLMHNARSENVRLNAAKTLREFGYGKAQAEPEHTEEVEDWLEMMPLDEQEDAARAVLERVQAQRRAEVNLLVAGNPLDDEESS